MEWPVSEKHPKTDLNTTPVYMVLWDFGKTNKRTGWFYTTKEEAEKVYKEKLEAGKNPSNSIHYYGGFVL